MNPASHLFQLQKNDSRALWIEHRLAEINQELTSNTAIVQAQQQEKTARENLEKGRLLLRNLEADTQAIRIKVQTSDAALYGGRIHNPKELQDIQNEIGVLKKRISSLEDEQLSTMLQLEELESVHSQTKINLDQTIAQVAQSQAGLNGELTSLEAEKSRLVIERSALNQQISNDLLFLYEKLRQQKRGLAVVNLQDGSCAACGTTLRPAEVQNAKAGLDVVLCSGCGRIIFAG